MYGARAFRVAICEHKRSNELIRRKVDETAKVFVRELVAVGSSVQLKRYLVLVVWLSRVVVPVDGCWMCVQVAHETFELLTIYKLVPVG